MSTSEKSQPGQLFGGLLKYFSTTKPQTFEQPKKRDPLAVPSKLLDETLAELQKRKQALRQERAVLGETSAAVSVSAEDIQKSIDLVRGRARAEILALHQTLGTRISEESLDNARLLLLELDEIVSGKRGAGFESRVRAAVIKDVLGRCAKPAWSSLNLLMERAKISWPEPSGLPPWAEAKDIAAASERMVSETAEAFFASSPARVADRMFGIVGVWKANYPEQASPQWRGLILQAAGYGIFAQIISEAVVKLRHDSDALMAEGMRLIAGEAESVQKALQGEVSSAEDVDKVMTQVSELCEEIIPELAWKTVASTVEEAVRRIVG